MFCAPQSPESARDAFSKHWPRRITPRPSEVQRMADTTQAIHEPVVAKQEGGFVRAIGLFDGTMIVVGSMIGSGIFIVAAGISRQTGSPGGLLLTWILTGLLTIFAAISYGELAGMFPRAGGQYVYLREAYSPLWGFLYGWTLFLVVQTGSN